MAHFNDQSRRILSHPCIVRFAGWGSTTPKLQNAGWQISVEQNCAFDRLNLIMRHKDARLYMVARSRSFMDVRERPPEFDIQHVVADIHVLRMDMDSADYAPIDAMPQSCIVDLGSISQFNIFAPALARTKEIIVEPKDVAECLALIQRLQAPDLEQVRERNRQRGEVSSQQVFHAQILSIV